MWNSKSILPNLYYVVAAPHLFQRRKCHCTSSAAERSILGIMTSQGRHIAVEEALPEGDHSLRLVFSDGVEGIVDVSDFLEYPAFRRFRDPEMFRRVYVEGGSPMWDGNTDISPRVLYCRATGCSYEDIDPPIATALMKDPDSKLAKLHASTEMAFSE